MLDLQRPGQQSRRHRSHRPAADRLRQDPPQPCFLHGGPHVLTGQAGSFRPGKGRSRRVGGDPLAVGQSPGAERGRTGPDSQGRGAGLGGATSLSPSFERWMKSKLGGWTSWFFSSKGGRSFRSFSRCGGKDKHRRVGTMRPLGFSRMRGRKTAARTTPLLHLQHGHSTRRCREGDHKGSPLRLFEGQHTKSRRRHYLDPVSLARYALSRRRRIPGNWGAANRARSRVRMAGSVSPSSR